MDEDGVACVDELCPGRGIRVVCIARTADVSSAAATSGSTDTCAAFRGGGLRSVDVLTAPAGVATVVTSTIVCAAQRRSGSFERHATGIAPCRSPRVESDAARDRRAARGAAPGAGSRGALDD